MLISCVSDLDSIDMEFFWEAIKMAKNPDLLLMAGDMYDFRSPETYGLILDFFKLRKWDCPVVAVYGNHEFDEDIDDIRKICGKRVTFLDDESVELKIGGKKIGIVGTRGSLDEPTWWQSKQVADVRKAYTDRIKKCEGLLSGLKSDVKILLSHYALTYKTLVGEDKSFFSGLGSKKFEKVLTGTGTSFAVHGHAHYGRPLAFVDSIPVFNAAFEITRKIVEIDPDNLPKAGLHKFVK
ncbi:MAG: metallophosphoesterase [Candidatus Aenigmatarchaeota archaeon]